jgi:hypothetical protein
MWTSAKDPPADENKGLAAYAKMQGCECFSEIPDGCQHIFIIASGGWDAWRWSKWCAFRFITSAL